MSYRSLTSYCAERVRYFLRLFLTTFTAFRFNPRRLLRLSGLFFHTRANSSGGIITISSSEGAGPLPNPLRDHNSGSAL